jgi:hypothetical protein
LWGRGQRSHLAGWGPGLAPAEGWTRLKKKEYLKVEDKGLVRPCLIESTGSGFNHAWTTPKASAFSVKARKDDYIKGVCSPGSKSDS